MIFIISLALLRGLLAQKEVPYEWFQHALCQGQDFSCYFFTNNWDQGDFRQYYLYNNLLGDGSLLGDYGLLPLLAFSGGLGGVQGGYGRKGHFISNGAAYDPAQAGCKE